MIKPNIERLVLLETMLLEVIAKKWRPSAPAAPGCEIPTGRRVFNLKNWFDNGTDNAHCGFTACAVGHACLDHRFTKAGLEMRGGHPVFQDKQGETHEGWNAVEEFFGLSERAAAHLFYAEEYLPETDPKASDVLKRLRKFLEHIQ